MASSEGRVNATSGWKYEYRFWSGNDHHASVRKGRPDYYILDGEKILLEPDFNKWQAWMEKNKVLLKTRVGDLEISTIFLGFDVSGHEKPELFETAVFRRNGGMALFPIQRHTSYEDAFVGHNSMTEIVRESLKINAPERERE